LTEFGFPQESESQTVTSLNATIAFLDGTDWVQRYAYFGNFRVGEGNDYLGQGGAIWDQNGQITGVGELWLGLKDTPQVASQSNSVRNHVGKLVWLIVIPGVLLLF
jgi:Glycosyl hydrolase catalytic core